MLRSKLLAAYNNQDKVRERLATWCWQVINQIYILPLKKLPRKLYAYAAASTPKWFNRWVTNSKLIYGFLIRVKLLKPSPNRRFIRADLTIDDFFRILNERGCVYAILRWWETLPQVAPNEDIDILVTDKDRSLMDDLVEYFGQGQKIDVYTERGMSDGAFHGVPYFKRNLATEILRNRVLYKNNYYVPRNEFYFLSLAYHALFHKGERACINGIPVYSENPEHDYQGVLERLSAIMNYEEPVTCKQLAATLYDRNFYPSVDLLTKLIDINASVAFLGPSLECDIRGGELLLYVVRGRAIDEGLLPKILKVLEADYRFDIIFIEVLDAQQRKWLRDEMRGGNWGRGPYALSGGDPHTIIAAFDYDPVPLPKEQQKDYRWFTNLHLLQSKIACRQLVEDSRFISKHFNPLHTTDNENEALYFIKKLLAPEKYKIIVGTLNSVREGYSTSFAVMEKISAGRRSKVEKIMWNGKPAIKKTFRRWATRYFRRELLVYESLANSIRYIPPLLERGENYLITEYYENQLDNINSRGRKKLLCKHRDKIIDVIKQFSDLGYAYINYTPDNIIITENGNLFCIDFEFLHEYEEAPKNIRETLEIRGIPKEFTGDLPVGFKHYNSAFTHVWEPVIGKF
jgi:hypothetical protein